MSTSERLIRINSIIDNHLHVWSSIPSFAPLAEVLRNDRELLTAKLLALGNHNSSDDRELPDAERLLILGFALERTAGRITSDHFTMFRDVETVQVILEDTFGFEFGPECENVLIPYQSEALKILIYCLFHRPRANEKDVLSFMRLFSRGGGDLPVDHDRGMRFRSIIWFIYLAIEIAITDESVCAKGIEYFGNRFGELLDHAIDGTIIDEESRQPGFEEGKWEKTLFGWLQGEDRKSFVEKLKRQFNMDNGIEHANRRLLAEHRRSVLEQVLVMFGR